MGGIAQDAATGARAAHPLARAAAAIGAPVPGRMSPPS